MDDKTALDDMCNGGREGYIVLYKRYARKVRHYVIKRYNLPEALADEVLQETFLGFCKNYEDFKCSIFTWLCRIADNKANDCWRNEFKHQHIGLDDEPNGDSKEDNNKGNILSDEPAFQNLMAEQVHDSEKSRCYQICLKRVWERLERDGSEPYLLECLSRALTFHVEGLTIKEIAIKMGRTPDATRSYLYQCRKRLKQYLPLQQCWEDCKDS